MFAGVIINLSEDSALVEVPVSHSEINCPPDSIIELRFDSISHGPINIACRAARIYAQNTSTGKVTHIGLKVDHIPSKYKDFFSTL